MQQPTDSPEQRFSKQMRLVREERGLSQAQLAEQLGERLGGQVDATAITRIERGSRAIRLDEARALADLLGLSLDDMMLDSVDSQMAVVLRARERRSMSDARAEYDREKYEAAVTRMRGVLEDTINEMVTEQVPDESSPEDLNKLRQAVAAEIRSERLAAGDDPLLFDDLLRGLFDVEHQ